MIGSMSSGVAQVTLQFKLNAAPFLLNQRLNLTPDSQIQIEQFKCYLGDGNQHYYLVDASDSSTYLLPEVYRVLQVGMDSIANTSDSSMVLLIPYLACIGPGIQGIFS